MPRRKKVAEQTPATATPPAPAAPIVPVIEPLAVYGIDALRAVLRLKESSLRREVREKRLTVRRRCGRHYFLGEDVLAWLRSAPEYAPPTLKAKPTPPRRGEAGEPSAN
jgi:hypothetical protein